jgi:transcriptional regulator
MRYNPVHDSRDPTVVRRLIEEYPWATLVSQSADGFAASHYPILLDSSTSDLAIVTHIGRPDDQVHDFGHREVLIIVAGEHGYISPSWYSASATPAPTWNFTVAHCYGIPEILDPEENLEVLTRLVAHFERHVEHPVLLDQDFGAKLSQGTVGIRLPITRFICKVKMSQDKDAESQRRVIDALRHPGPYRHPRLADDMEHALGGPHSGSTGR